jgi:hypothetical protein
MKDWKADYERRSNLGFAVNNIKGFEEEEQDLLLTYGKSHSLPLKVRKVHLHDSSYLDVEWTESLHGMAARFTVPTESLSGGMDGVSIQSALDYIDSHVDSGFERLLADSFQPMPFNLHLIESIYRFYLRDRTPTIRNSLKAITGYIFAHRISMVDSPHKSMAGCVEDPLSKYYGRTMAPAMVNFQVICAMGDAWRELHRILLADLSAYYKGVYSGEKLRNWGSIFALSTILLILWERMQFDSFFHMEVFRLSRELAVIRDTYQTPRTKQKLLTFARRWRLFPSALLSDYLTRSPKSFHPLVNGIPRNTTTC